MAGPALVLSSHGTRDPAGRAVIDELRHAVGSARPGVEVVEAYVDEQVQQPGLSRVLAGLTAGFRPAVVVPVLLSGGYHLHHDVADAVARAGPGVRAARSLGPDAVLVEVLADRLAEVGAGTDHAVVLTAAGSSDPRAAQDIRWTASELASRICSPVIAAYASSSTPDLSTAVAGLAIAGRPVAVASYLLAPGHFLNRLREVPAAVHTAPLLPDRRITELVLSRYDEAVTAG